MDWIWLDKPEDHNRWGVNVKPSLLLNGKEMGLFANKDFVAGAKIAPYLGEELSLEQRRLRYGKKWGPYVYFKPWGHPSIDAIFYRGAAAFANDGTWIPNPHGGKGYSRRVNDMSNTYLEKGWLKASRDLKNGDELLLDYGESYWKNRFFFGNNVMRFDNPSLINPSDLENGRRSAVGGSPVGPIGPVVPKKTKTKTKTIIRMKNYVNPCSAEIDQLTPVELRDQYWFKRDDLFEICGAKGGKSRACFSYVCHELSKHHGVKIQGLITGGSRSSPQVQIVGYIAKCLGLRARLHIPRGEIPDYIKRATSDLGHEVYQWFPGFNHVISTRVKEDVVSQHEKWIEIPFGMEFTEALECTSNQVKNLPFPKFNRIVIPVGSAMTLIGIILGLNKMGHGQTPILGVYVGKDPVKMMDKWLPSINWRETVTLVKSPHKYHQIASVVDFGGISLDPIYEAKVIPFVKPGDLLWIIGHR